MSAARRSRLVRHTLAPLACLVLAWLAMPGLVDLALGL